MSESNSTRPAQAITNESKKQTIIKPFLLNENRVKQSIVYLSNLLSLKLREMLLCNEKKNTPIL